MDKNNHMVLVEKFSSLISVLTADSARFPTGRLWVATEIDNLADTIHRMFCETKDGKFYWFALRGCAEQVRLANFSTAGEMLRVVYTYTLVQVGDL